MPWGDDSDYGFPNGVKLTAEALENLKNMAQKAWANTEKDPRKWKVFKNEPYNYGNNRDVNTVMSGSGEQDIPEGPPPAKRYMKDLIPDTVKETKKTGIGLLDYWRSTSPNKKLSDFAGLPSERDELAGNPLMFMADAPIDLANFAAGQGMDALRSVKNAAMGKGLSNLFPGMPHTTGQPDVATVDDFANIITRGAKTKSLMDYTERFAEHEFENPKVKKALDTAANMGTSILAGKMIGNQGRSLVNKGAGYSGANKVVQSNNILSGKTQPKGMVGKTKDFLFGSNEVLPGALVQDSYKLPPLTPKQSLSQYLGAIKERAKKTKEIFKPYENVVGDTSKYIQHANEQIATWRRLGDPISMRLANTLEKEINAMGTKWAANPATGKEIMDLKRTMQRRAKSQYDPLGRHTEAGNYLKGAAATLRAETERMAGKASGKQLARFNEEIGALREGRKAAAGRYKSMSVDLGKPGYLSKGLGAIVQPVATVTGTGLKALGKVTPVRTGIREADKWLGEKPKQGESEEVIESIGTPVGR